MKKGKEEGTEEGQVEMKKGKEERKEQGQVGQ